VTTKVTSTCSPEVEYSNSDIVKLDTNHVLSQEGDKELPLSHDCYCGRHALFYISSHVTHHKR